MRDSMKRPDKLARQHIPRANVASGTLRTGFIDDVAAGDHKIPEDKRCGCDSVVKVEKTVHDFRGLQIYNAVVSESTYWRTALCVDGVQFTFLRREQNSRRGSPITGPISQTAHRPQTVSSVISRRRVTPKHFACFRFQRGDVIQGPGQIHDSADD